MKKLVFILVGFLAFSLTIAQTPPPQEDGLKVLQNTELLILTAVVADSVDTTTHSFLRVVKANSAGDPVNINDFPMLFQYLNNGFTVDISVFIHGETQVESYWHPSDGDGLMDGWGSLYIPITDFE